jgi:hypothetical protein
MPSRVPHHLFFKRLILQLRNNLVTYLRFLLVCFIWLGLVPFLARWIWRFYFRFGDWSASRTSPSTTPNATDTTETNSTDPVTNATVSHGVFEDGVFGWLRGQDLWTSVLRDCFQGQIITICLVAVFVVVFLIREWVMQNAMVIEEIPVEQQELQELPPVDVPNEPAVIDVPRNNEGATGVQPQHQQQQQYGPPTTPPEGGGEWQEIRPGAWVGPIIRTHNNNTPPQLDRSRTGSPATEYDADVADPFQDEPRFPDWARQRDDYLVDPFTNPPPQAEDVEAALAHLAQRRHQQPLAIPMPPALQPPPIQPDDVNFRNNLDNAFNIAIDNAFNAGEFGGDEDDDLDVDDFEGLWDIIGMQGPIIGLLHNTVFSALMIALAVGLGVWLPFMFGKTALGALVLYPTIPLGDR